MRKLFRAALLSAAAIATGCDSVPVAEGDRSLQLEHVPGSGILVDSRNGSIVVETDATRSDVSVDVHVRAAGATMEDAMQRLARFSIEATRDASGTLVLKPVFPGPAQGNDGASFTVRAPGVWTVDLRSSNGSVTVRDAQGRASLQTSNGSVTAERVGGGVEGRSSNGRITVEQVKGGIDVRTSNGSITVQSADGPIAAESTNGRLELRDVGGPIRASTSNGSVVLVLRPDFPGTLEVSTSNGGVTANTSDTVVRTEIGKHDATIVFRTPGEASRVTSSNGSVTIDAKK
ncbi:MAG: DUF4097 family beta strand repeat-containing protein [Phycisphaerales bacterium]